jgi:tRNA pseudouridine55 synthase
MDGILVVDKPAGMTSHDVVDAVRRQLKTKKVGHAGTLDPDATGLLVLGVGRGTRLLKWIQAHPKRYRATARFGISTSTQDASGEVIDRRDAGGLSEEDVRAQMKSFTGVIEQIPPMVSAVKVGGERLYKKARRGEEVERAPRRVTISSFELLSFSSEAQAEASFDVECSGGTYIRTLVHDLGEALGCGAHMTQLRRTETGGFVESDAAALDAVTPDAMRPLVEAVRMFDKLEVGDEAARFASHGRPIPIQIVGSGGTFRDGDVVPLAHAGELIAVYVSQGDALVADTVIPR